MKYKFLLLFLILFLVPNVYASDYKLNSHISATSGGTKNRYGGLENYNYGSYGTYTFGTRYQGRLGNIETYIDYPFEANTTYTLTYNMNTDDFINHFGSSYWWDCSQAMTNSNATVQSVNYISYKKVKFTFTPTANTTCIYVSIRSTSPNNTSITQITNWQLDSIYLYDPDYQGGGSGGSGGTPTPTSDPNQDIINNNNQNTSDIIDNNNENTNKIIDTEKELLGNCYKNLYNKNDITSGKWLTSDNWINDDNTWSYSNFISITPNTTYTSLYYGNSGSAASIVFYDSNKNFISGITHNERNVITWTSPSNAVYVRDSVPLSSINQFMIIKGSHSNFEYLSFNQEKCYSKLDDSTNAINDVNNSINNDNVDHGVGSGFFDDFEDNDYGLSSIITIPLNTIQSLTSTSCVALQIPIPFTNSSVSLPCMTEIYEQNVPTIYNLWKIVSFGIIAYFIAIDIFHMVKGFKDPDSDKVEVLDL